MAKLCVLPSLVFGLRYRAQHFLLQIFWASCLALQRKPLSNHCSVACANCTDSIHMSFSISSNKLALLHRPRRCARTVCSLIRGSSMPPHMLGACWNLAARCHCRALGLIWTPITAFQDLPRSSKILKANSTEAYLYCRSGSYNCPSPPSYAGTEHQDLCS